MRGGRVRVTRPVTTNGGVTFEIGEILRLDRMVPLSSDQALFGMHFQSTASPNKFLNVSAVQLTYESDCGFELVLDEA